MAIIELGTDRLDVDLEADVVVVADPVLDGPAERLSGWWAAGLAVAWVAIFTAGVLLEPAPANPDASAPLIATVLGLGLMLGWLVMAVGFATRRRYGAASSLLASVVLVGMTIACPVSGHHSGIGAWWFFELAGSTALVGLSARALKTA
jgi:hypothetical protein